MSTTHLVQANIAETEAFRVILAHEKIPYTTGIGPGTVVFEFSDEDVEKVKTVMDQWKRAVVKLYFEVGGLT